MDWDVGLVPLSLMFGGGFKPRVGVRSGGRSRSLLEQSTNWSGMCASSETIERERERVKERVR